MQIRDRIKELRRVPASELIPNPKNWRVHPTAQQDALRGVLAEVGYADALIARETPEGLMLVDGHLRAETTPDSDVPVLVLDINEAEADLMLATLDPLAAMAGRDEERLAELLSTVSSDNATVNALLQTLANGYEPLTLPEPQTDPPIPRGSLNAKFLVPPFSVLDARQGYWQERKRSWLALGIESELGRGSSPGTRARADDPSYREIGNRKPSVSIEWPIPVGGGGYGVKFGRRHADRQSNLNNEPPTPEWATGTGTENMAAGTSIFDPVLCEIAYSWFCPPAGSILDPFAGGSVRGIIAAYLGRGYTGIDLRPEQVTANEEQAQAIVPDNMPAWIVGDSRTAIPAVEYDFVFSCPPYYDLEQYSDVAADLSNAADYDSFILAYRQIIQTSVDRLRPDSFACFVVGDIRDDHGIYRNFVGDTVNAFQDAGAGLYNEAILVTAVGSLPIRVGRQFEAGRKLGKTHQNVLIFYKGEPGRIRERLGEVDISAALAPFDEVKV
jgi:hypothetical protein